MQRAHAVAGIAQATETYHLLFMRIPPFARRVSTRGLGFPMFASRSSPRYATLVSVYNRGSFCVNEMVVTECGAAPGSSRCGESLGFDHDRVWRDGNAREHVPSLFPK